MIAILLLMPWLPFCVYAMFVFSWPTFWGPLMPNLYYYHICTGLTHLLRSLEKTALSVLTPSCLGWRWTVLWPISVREEAQLTGLGGQLHIMVIKWEKLLSRVKIGYFCIIVSSAVPKRNNRYADKSHIERLQMVSAFSYWVG